nr:magnesium-chelatase subunit ChlD, chloroplastic [Ipomoea batatas]
MEAIRGGCQTSILELQGHRAEMYAARVAKCLAAFEGHDKANVDDLKKVVSCVSNMDSFTFFTIEAADLLQKLSLESKPNTLEIPEPTKKVCIIPFRGDTAEVLLPPSRSISMAKKRQRLERLSCGWWGFSACSWTNYEANPPGNVPLPNEPFAFALKDEFWYKGLTGAEPFVPFTAPPFAMSLGFPLAESTDKGASSTAADLWLGQLE